MNIVSVGYDSTNYYILDAQGGKLLVDCGWPGTLPKLTAEVKRKGMALKEIKYLLVTHFHPDHAGIAQDLKNLGVKLILLETQPAYIPQLTQLFKSKKRPYLEIKMHDNLLLRFEDSRAFLHKLGICGEILSTPGHSDDSISLILDEGLAFTGDLPPRFIISEDNHLALESWDKIYQHRITRIFPAHGS